MGDEVVGETFARLEGDREFSVCGTQECNLGNVLTDAMVFNELLSAPPSSGWSDYPIAITTASSIRASIEPGKFNRNSMISNSVVTFTNTLNVLS